ncbi:MAG: hypothetical protein K9M75_04035 [Phycisphaerae bacterium]|nr:hypothetical protein [Phycisphaerae bacterium]
MKLRKIATIAIMALTAILLTGCQDEQLTKCQQENTELRAKVESIEKILEENTNTLQGTMAMAPLILGENERLKRENDFLHKQLQAALESQTKKPEQTPEQKAKIKKGLQELFELQKESAEKMRLEKLKKDGKE